LVAVVLPVLLEVLHLLAHTSLAEAVLTVLEAEVKVVTRVPLVFICHPLVLAALMALPLTAAQVVQLVVLAAAAQVGI
jgi:hypothetical protein